MTMESKGIEADLPQTNLEAVIPEEQKVLLEVNSDRYGIHQPQFLDQLKDLGFKGHKVLGSTLKQKNPQSSRSR